MRLALPREDFSSFSIYSTSLLHKFQVALVSHSPVLARPVHTLNVKRMTSMLEDVFNCAAVAH